ncbi:MAG: cupredoxin domain-containing protein [Deinococcus sp.]
MNRPNRRALAALLLGASLVSAQAATSSQVYRFKLNPSAGEPKAAGQALVRQAAGQGVDTTLILSGLTPGAAYAAHYHAFGPLKTSDPCASDGPITLGFPPFKASRAGRATVKLHASPADAAKIAGDLGAYINVHQARDLGVVPLCAPLVTARSGAAPAASPAAASPANTATPAAPAAPAPSSTATTSPASTPAASTVEIGDNFFRPQVLKIKVGTTVTWTHNGMVTHNVISSDLPALQSPDLKHGDRYSYTFMKAGTFRYYCAYHANMTATIVVTDR